ncbi:hypothetical protein APHAL10511_001423 [Amanita phalloides]|nr:hypothetical protein APHAL10511_001423 [Amanita phalloides]
MRPLLKEETSTTPDDMQPSPRSSVYTTTTTESTLPNPAPQLMPSIPLLFSLLSRRHFLFLLLPAILISVIAGGVAPFMTYVVGQTFNAFSQFPLTPHPPQEAKQKLLHAVGLAALELISLAVASLALSSITSCLWIWIGETNTLAVRRQVYLALTQKEMSWFDTKMCADHLVHPVDGDEQLGPIGAGGLMAKFAKETDDIRMASSLASGMLVQYLTTSITCLALAFTRSWALTLVILSAVPVLIFIQGLSQSIAGPLLAKEEAHTASAATLVDRAISGIVTVKAFNAIPHELSVASATFHSVERASCKLTGVWGATSGLAQFVMMSMFVQGFWFGAKLVRNRTVSSGDIMAVFWACLIATNNLQMCIPQFIVLAKGKHAIASLLTLAGDKCVRDHDASRTSTATVAFQSTHSIYTPSRRSVHSARRRIRTRPSQQLRRIMPSRCLGEFSLHGVTFAYPSRPDTTVLADVSIYLPAHETTFIVGASGSGKSTIAQLLLRMYHPQQGAIQLDDQDVRYIDESWMRRHISGVRQGECVVVDGSVWDNVVLGLEEQENELTKEAVEEACRAAMVHEFVKDLPDGYDTRLGGAGVGLSGGQKQRLALARARLRNPPVLILDEATSALDATSRILVFEALKRWRESKTTIVITHDLSQIESTDFVYVLKDGRIVEQGYRSDLENPTCRVESEFCAMLDAQMQTGGYLPEKDMDGETDAETLPVELLDGSDDGSMEVPFTFQHLTIARTKTLRRATSLANWMFEAVANITSAPEKQPPSSDRDTKRISRFVPPEAFKAEMKEDKDLEMACAVRQGRRRGSKRPASLSIPSFGLPDIPSPVKTAASRRFSLQFTPTSPVYPVGVWDPWNGRDSVRSSTKLVCDDEEFEDEKDAMTRTANLSCEKRQPRPRARWDDTKVIALDSVKIDVAPVGSADPVGEECPKFWSLLTSVFPTIPYKPIFFFGVLICLASGAMTPLFSFLLSRLLFEVSIGAHNTQMINKFGAMVLSVAALDGILIGAKYFIMEFAGTTWVTRIRKRAFAKILAQDKTFFDKERNSSSRLVQTLIKDGDDTRDLISVVIGQCLVVSAMLGVGIVWALIRGWQLTLAGVAIAPVFAGAMALQTGLAAKCELRNKRAREAVAQTVYDAIVNIRAIRSMSIGSTFRARFENAANEALVTGIRGAMIEGCTLGIASGLIYLAEALLFYVGAVLVAKGTYTYLQMVEVLNLVVFSVSIGSQLMAFTHKFSKSVQATNDFNKLLKLSTHTEESRGVLRPVVSGAINFANVDFSYRERADVPVLKHINMHIVEGQCVAIVGPSGCGKSTIASLLQRLYEPLSGVITVGGMPLYMINVEHLRHHIAVVSQNPNLFDTSIADNIRYGNNAISDADIKRATQAAHVHEFIMSLPQGYDTLVGENAALISGGQAQRIQLARALARAASVLVLDECTSALDPANQAAVLETIKDAKVGRTTIMVTHKLAVMRMCDRIILIDDGEVKEEGTYEELMERQGHFATLAGGGEWIGD